MVSTLTYEAVWKRVGKFSNKMQLNILKGGIPIFGYI